MSGSIGSFVQEYDEQRIAFRTPLFEKSAWPCGQSRLGNSRTEAKEAGKRTGHGIRIFDLSLTDFPS